MPQTASAPVIELVEAAATVPSTPGPPFGGGFFSHVALIDGKPFAIIVAPKAAGDFDDLPWQAALDRAKALTIDGHSDWDLPTRQEALAIYEGLQPVLKGSAEEFEEDWYWTKQENASYPSYAWYQSFTNGHQPSTHKVSRLRARVVRRVAI